MGLAEAARPAVATDPRSVGDPRQRGDAAADAGVASHPEVASVHGRLPVACGVCRGLVGRRAAPVAGPRLSAASPEPACRGSADRGDRRVSLDPRRRCSRLPGVGSYTARAVLAFAFEADVAVVDTNIARVLARVAGHRLTPKDGAGRRRRGASRRRLVGVEPVPDGPRRGPVPTDVAAVRGVPAERMLSHGGGAVRILRWGRPASAGRQGRFDGSDRQARGRLMKALDRRARSPAIDWQT